MTVKKPFRRTVRIFTDDSYSEGGRARYIEHPRYAESPESFIRAFLLIQKDLLTLFDYIEPSDINEQTHSFRIHELLLRTCIEVEANLKAILKENGCEIKIEKKDGSAGIKDEKWWNMKDYAKVNQSHYLSQYEVKVHGWIGEKSIRTPFSAWANVDDRLSWYTAYNSTKHDRYSNFKEASFQHLIDAVSGLAVLLASQFMDNDFSPSDNLLSIGGRNDGYEDSIGGFFRIKYPSSIPKDKKYDFDWQFLKDKKNPFQNFTYL